MLVEQVWAYFAIFIYEQRCSTKMFLVSWLLCNFSSGRGAKEANLYSEIAQGISSYGVTRHRHGIISQTYYHNELKIWFELWNDLFCFAVPEIEQGLSDVAQSKVTVSFTPHLMPMVRIISSLFSIVFHLKPFIDLHCLGRSAECNQLCMWKWLLGLKPKTYTSN